MAAFKKPMCEVEQDWIEWIENLEEPGVPFLGVVPRRGPRNVQVKRVIRGSAAETSGILSGDTIIGLGRESVETWDDFVSAISSFDPGDTVDIVVQRNGKTVRLKAKLGSRTM